MSGGNKRVVFNTRERVISTDQTRHQAFGAADRAEVLRRLMNMRGSPVETGSYVDTNVMDAAAVGTPLKGDVYDGLVVLPQAATLNLLVSPGAVGLDDPDGETGSSDPATASTDDSRYKVVVDPGVLVAGSLTIAAGSGATRVDTIEVQRQTVVLETDSRDIFDPSTGTFTPVSVPKVSVGRLLYRVRAGTPGGGLPALEQGWLPLCIAIVPSSATSVDTMTFWDVRPLVSGRVFPSSDAFVQDHSPKGRFLANSISGSGTTIYGYASSNINMYRAGGAIIGPDALKIDINTAAYQVPGFTPAAGDFWNLVAIFPASLPRWVQYLASPLPRIPTGPCGVLAITGVGPDSDGNYTSVTPPTASGLPAGPAVQLGAGYDFAGLKPGGIVFQDGLVMFEPNSVFAATPPAAVTAATDRYDLTLNDHFPGNARSLLVYFQCTFTGSADARYEILRACSLIDPGGGITDQFWAQALGKEVGTLNGTTVILQTQVVEIPLTYRGVNNGLANNDISVLMSWTGSGFASRSAESMVIVGWRL